MVVKSLRGFLFVAFLVVGALFSLNFVVATNCGASNGVGSSRAPMMCAKRFRFGTMDLR